MSWRKAFLSQARSDDAVRRLLAADPAVAVCHQLHYLQMCSEKLAKALSGQSDTPPAQTHVAIVRFLQLLKSRRDLRQRLGRSADTASFERFIDSLLPLARRIEQLAPAAAGAGRPNAEYPWLDPAAGEAVAPADFAFADFDASDSQVAKLEDLIAALLRLGL